MANNNFSTPAAIMLALKVSEIGPAMRYTMHCTSGVSAARLARIDPEKDTALLGNAVNFPFNDSRICEAWNAGDLGPEFRAPVTSSVPALRNRYSAGAIVFASVSRASSARVSSPKHRRRRQLSACPSPVDARALKSRAASDVHCDVASALLMA
jgi:hypothetical protein